MYIKFIREDVIEGLQKSSGIIPAKTGAAFLRTIWLEAKEDKLKIRATDSNIEFTGNYPAIVGEEGLVGVQGKTFADLIRKLKPGEISLRLKENILIVEQGKRRYRLPTSDPSWFQNFENFPNENKVLWSGDILKEIIQKISFCISDDDTMEGMTCMSFKAVSNDHIEICGLNGHQFALLKFKNEDIHRILPEDGFLISKKFLTELKKWLSEDEIEISLSNKRLFFRTQENKEIFSFPLSVYNFPDYHELLNKYEDHFNSVLEINKDDLIESLDRLMIFNSETSSTYFKLNENELLLYVEGTDIGEAYESLPCNYKGTIKNIVLLTKDVIDILNHFDSKIVKFHFSGQTEPCKITGDEDYSYMVITMPVEIEEEVYYTEEEVE
ncbi:DNA polymerase III subunit beta [Desulfohalobiaceae bacterium Ax17]|uniref:DNA polymerase III subunit beta n=1 Tax=Desulfovulcanus ferrireducens TaxID=2831190 RepID=UPI00207BB2CE|nr:DNA polymerase III subunit beta [Desulfovulcanus ferrireducens]MBT8763492.1 DNA polymerase III subunit beta [Desulfovulcanus ferrireducens]